MNRKYSKRAFTLVELLIVIAIIGILFVVLISKVDFAGDKSKITGVQTDFRSFQMALEQVAKENAGFNTFGWDTGDLNGDRIRNSYDEKDTNKNGVRDAGESAFTGRKLYGEEWTGIYTLINPGNFDDMSAIEALETAINANLDPKLHVTINDDFTITMANGAQDPWNREYYGRYISNAAVDNLDRGVITLYSSGTDGVCGLSDGVAGGLVNIANPTSSANGKDDLAFATFYTLFNGSGEVRTITYGFSSNLTFEDASGVPVTPVVDKPVVPDPVPNPNPETPEVVDPDNPFQPSIPGVGGNTPGNDEPNNDAPVNPETGEIIENVPDVNPEGTINSYSWEEIKALAQLKLTPEEYKNKYGIELGQKKYGTYILVDFGLDDNNDGTYDNYSGFVFMYQTGGQEFMYQSGMEEHGYESSDLLLRMNAMYNSLKDVDEDLYMNIKNVTVAYSDNKFISGVNNPYTDMIENCKVFVASYSELGFVGTNSYAYLYEAEGTKFDYFIEGTSVEAIARRDEICGDEAFWTRSVNLGYTTEFYSVENGIYKGCSAANELAVVACFVIG